MSDPKDVPPPVDPNPPGDLPGTQSWFWSPEWQAGEQAASAEAAAGLGDVYDDSESFLASLA